MLLFEPLPHQATSYTIQDQPIRTQGPSARANQNPARSGQTYQGPNPSAWGRGGACLYLSLILASRLVVKLRCPSNTTLGGMDERSRSCLHDNRGFIYICADIYIYMLRSQKLKTCSPFYLFSICCYVTGMRSYIL